MFTMIVLLYEMQEMQVLKFRLTVPQNIAYFVVIFWQTFTTTEFAAVPIFRTHNHYR